MATLNLQVGASADDAYSLADGSNTTTNAVFGCLGYSNGLSGEVWNGMRFQNVTIPAGSTITEATLTLREHDSFAGSGQPDVDVYGEDTDDAAAFTTDANNITDRTLTTANVAWDPAQPTNDNDFSSPDLKTIIQEIVDRAGWESGNDIVLITKGTDNYTGPDYVFFETYDKDTNNAPKLDITYTEPSRYWVGDTDPAVWNDTNHWSTTAGGAGGASVPSTGNDVFFTSDNTNSCTVDADISIKSLSIASGYTGTFDNATNDKDVTVSGDVTLDGTRVDMGDGTWTVSGDFDWLDVTTFRANLSTLIMDGGTSGTPLQLIGPTSFSNGIGNLTIPADCYTVIPSASGSIYILRTATVAGTLTISSSETIMAYGASAILNVTSTGKITGGGTFRMESRSKLAQQDGTIDVAAFEINGVHDTSDTSIIPATYESAAFRVRWYSTTNASWVPSAGTYTFNGDFAYIVSSTGNCTIDNSVNNPNFVFKKGISISTTSTGLALYTKGTGTITFSGTSAQTADFLDKAVEDIVISNTSATVSLTGNGVTTDSLTVDSGATFDLNGENLSYASASSTTNNGTIRLQGGETLTNVNDLDTDSGTVVYYGDNGGGGSPFTIKDFGTTDYYNLTFNATLGTDVFRPADTLTVANDLTITQGTFDNATNDENINVTGNVTMDNTRVDMGDGTWTVSGNWDSYHVTTFAKNASTLIMDGVGKNLYIYMHAAKVFYNLTIAEGASITQTNTCYPTYDGGTFQVNGTYTVPSGKGSYVYWTTLKVSSTGNITGAGTMVLSATDISQQDGTIDVATLTLHRVSNSDPIVPATFDSASVTIANSNDNTSRTWSPATGTYTFNGNVTISGNIHTTYSFTINNSTNNPNFVFGGNVTFTNGTGTLNWTKGTGTITFAGTTAQSADFLGKTVEDINITNTSADVSITNDVTCDSLSASDNASIKVTAGKTITTDSVNDLGGSAGNLVTVVSSSPGDVWYLVASGTPVVSYIDVTDSDASGGSEINTVGSVDGGNNTNWVFAVIKDIIQAGIIIFKR